ncbi:TetR/AcrR family transcriptional regulator [Spirillospora sp. NPDC050679]
MTTDAPDRRTRLLQAAAELFTEHPYDAVTTTQIARRAGVAYGLIAHHFTNKRGLYVATVQAAADRLRSVRDAPPEGGTPQELLHNALERHIAYIDDNAAGFLALMHGGNGADPEVRAIIEDLRWEGARRILDALGVADPALPLLRTTMRGWVGFLDETIIDRLRHGDVPRGHLVALAAATLSTALRTAATLEPESGISAEVLDALP